MNDEVRTFTDAKLQSIVYSNEGAPAFRLACFVELSSRYRTRNQLTSVLQAKHDAVTAQAQIVPRSEFRYG